MTEEQAVRIEAAGFARYNARGMTNPVIARKLGITTAELKMFRKYRGVPSSSYAKRDWLREALRKEASKTSYYHLNISTLADRLGTTGSTLGLVFAETGVPKPKETRKDFVRQLRQQGIRANTIGRALGVSEHVVRTA